MYYYLRQIAAEEGERFRNVLAQTDDESIRGVHLNVDRYWLESFKQSHRASWNEVPFPWDGYRLADLMRYWQALNWERHCRNRGLPERASPVYWQVILREPDQIRQLGPNSP